MSGEGTVWEPAQLRDFRAQFQADPALRERILREFPPVAQPERVTVRTDTVSADAATARALALAVAGVEAQIELLVE